MMDVKFLKPFIDGARSTMEIQCQLPSTPMKPFIKRGGPKVLFDIAGVTGLTSSAFHGSIALCFPEKTFLAAMSNMLGESYTEITDDMQDGAAELINIIFGHAKRVLNDGGYDIAKAIPTVLRGRQMEMQHFSDEPVVVIPFETASGIFYIEIANSKREAA